MSVHLKKPLIYLITKGETTDQNFAEKSRQILDIIRVAVAERIPLVQLREKQLTAKLLFLLTQQVADLTRESDTKLLVNDRADIAEAAGADGVHLTSTSIAVDVVRQSFHSEFIVGVSTHTKDEVLTAARNGADFAVFGPVFDSPGKGDPKGVSQLTQICGAAGEFPVLGLGGIDGSNCGQVLEAGARGVAAIRWLNDAVELRQTARTLIK